MRPRIPKHTNTTQKNQKLNQLGQQFQAAYMQGDYQQALLLAVQAHRIVPKNISLISDAATCAVLLGKWQEAIDWAKKGLKIQANHINCHDVLAHAYGGLHDWAACGAAGLRALTLRDERFSPEILPELPIPPRTGDLAVVSFSLFGNNPAYIESAVLNAQVMPEIYPDWQAWFYVNDTVPETARERLRQAGAHVIQVDEEAAQFPGTMWRFLALDDERVAYAVFRDADSVVSPREAHAVAQWIASGKHFHTLRDAGSHTELILAGLWGAMGGSLNNMREQIRAYLANNKADGRFDDQYFLRQCIWPYVKQSLFATDRLFGFMDAHPFPENHLFDYEQHHVGCDEARRKVNIALSNIQTGQVCWALYSRAQAMLNADYSMRLNETEREICRYVSPVVNGSIKVALPQRYAHGLEQGWSRIAVVEVMEKMV